MENKPKQYIRGTPTDRKTESDYLGVLLDAVPLEEWRSIIVATLIAAKEGDPGARAWLGNYLMGKPLHGAPAPLTVVVQQIAGHDPIVENIALPHFVGTYRNHEEAEAFHDRLRGLIAEELRNLESPKLISPENEVPLKAKQIAEKQDG